MSNYVTIYMLSNYVIMCNHWNVVAVTDGCERNQYIGHAVFLKNIIYKHIKMQKIEYTGRK